MRVLACASCALALSLGGAAQAALIGLDLDDFPDIASGFITTSFEGGTGTFLATGFALEYDDDGSVPAELIVGGSFQLGAIIDASGEATAGSLQIGGTVGGAGPSLLTADLTDFGFIDGGGEILEFAFAVTGGDLAADFGGLGAMVGVILDVGGLGYSGDWTRSFAASAGVADTAPIPAPAAFLILAGASLCAGRRRRQGVRPSAGRQRGGS